MSTYIAIDLKSFYASVECVQRHLDPLTTNLVVADTSRTEKTICLAVSPSLKSYGIGGRARLFEVIARLKEVNAARLAQAIRDGKTSIGRGFASSSFDDIALKEDSSLEVSYIAAPPRMALYMAYSTRVYNIYLKYIAPEDIHVYSIDECFLDVTKYLKMYRMTAQELAMTIIREVLFTTGITATGGIGTNLYLCKIAMDIVAKHATPDKDGVRLAELDEASYRQLLWAHQPLTDFWRVGPGTVRKLNARQLYTMGDVARYSLQHADTLYKQFGVNAELLIDHAWGRETCTMQDIKQYRPSSNSLSSGQVLPCPYDKNKGALIVREMADLLALDLVKKHLLTDQLTLTVCYDHDYPETYTGPIEPDFYGRSAPRRSHGSINMDAATNSARKIIDGLTALYERIMHPELMMRRLYIGAMHVTRVETESRQLDFFTSVDEIESQAQESAIQQTLLSLQARFGKNAVLKGMNLEEGATTIERNGQVGGHKA